MLTPFFCFIFKNRKLLCQMCFLIQQLPNSTFIFVILYKTFLNHIWRDSKEKKISILFVLPSTILLLVYSLFYNFQGTSSFISIIFKFMEKNLSLKSNKTITNLPRGWTTLSFARGHSIKPKSLQGEKYKYHQPHLM